MMPNSFSSIVGVKFELLTALKPVDDIFYEAFNKFAINKCEINLIVFPQ